MVTKGALPTVLAVGSSAEAGGDTLVEMSAVGDWFLGSVSEPGLVERGVTCAADTWDSATGWC
jgi:hypothetical protein